MVDTKQVRIGDVIKVQFEITVESIRKSVHKDEMIEFGGWIELKENDKTCHICLVSVPEISVLSVNGLA